MIEQLYKEEARMWLDEAKTAQSQEEFDFASMMALAVFVNMIDDPIIRERREFIQQEIERKRQADEFNKKRALLFDHHNEPIGSRIHAAIDLGVRWFVLLGPDRQYKDRYSIAWGKLRDRFVFEGPSGPGRPIAYDFNEAPVTHLENGIVALDLEKFVTENQASENLTSFAFADSDEHARELLGS